MATHGYSICDSFDVAASTGEVKTIDTATEKVIITKAIAVNYTGTDYTLTVYVDADGTGSANLNKKVDALTIPSNSTVSLDELVGITILGGGRVSASSSSATAIALTIVGTKYP